MPPRPQSLDPGAQSPDNAPVPCPQLILASRSPRRAALLRNAGYRFTVMAPAFEDPPSPGQSDPAGLAVDLSRRKAASVVAAAPERCMILAADTIVLAPEASRWIALGQPRDRLEAADMLGRLLNTDHRVLTAVSIHSTEVGRIESFVDVTGVHIGQVADTQLQEYLDSEQWRGKAGAYNILELRERWSFELKGDPTTVAGLPMVTLQPRLLAWSILPQAPQPGSTTT